MKTKILALSVSIMAILFIVAVNCNKDEEKQEEKANQVPTCQITAPANGQEITKGETVTISVDATDSDGTITEVLFFIDGVGKGSVNSFPYNYDWATSSESIGNHTIKATSIDNNGGSKSDEITVDIIEEGDIPIANFSANTTSGPAPLTVNFTDQSTNNPSSWEWDFGDGGTSIQQSPSHTYNANGIYTVTQTATNSFGSDTETKENYINVGGTGEPCPGTPTVYYQGQTYNTVLIGGQCWMKENLNYETGISWCYDNDPANCATYGRLYDWETIMNGEASSNSVPSGVQGICPNGWHLPSDEEWKILEGTVDTQYGVGHSEWDDSGWRGFDAGKRLKTTTGWSPNTGTDIYGFSALPSGCQYDNGSFCYLDYYVYFWSSTEYDNDTAWYRRLSFHSDEVACYYYYKGCGFSARCVKD
jgi:uncharacterized protein (TIGR02145 family)